MRSRRFGRLGSTRPPCWSRCWPSRWRSRRSGGLLGGLVAYAGFNGYQTSTINFQTFSQVAFAFRVTPALLVTGLVWSLAMGLFGGFFPAVRAARLPIATALREL